MGKQKISEREIKTIIELRKTGHTISEIKKIVPRGSGTIFKYIKNVSILPSYQKTWDMKRGGSKAVARKKWAEANEKAASIVSSIGKKEKIIIAACLYWGEGTKRDFSLSNTDPDLIKTFVMCLKELGISSRDLRVTVRIYEDIDRNKAVSYWAKVMGIPKKQIINVNILHGKKTGKLLYGMCRVRVTKGAPHLKLLQSVVKTINIHLGIRPRSSMDRTAHS